jgi:mannose-6-phosphate isomerase-like protein (cupin superfamily)
MTSTLLLSRARFQIHLVVLLVIVLASGLSCCPSGDEAAQCAIADCKAKERAARQQPPSSLSNIIDESEKRGGYVDFSEVQGCKINKPFERELKVIMSPDVDPDVKGFTLLVSTLAPNGGCTDMHSHASEGELMIFMSGRGKAWLDKEEYALKPGIAIYAPPGVPHKTLNTGDNPLMIACVFVPPIDTGYIQKNVAAAQKAGSKP